jgi:NAD+ kinase
MKVAIYSRTQNNDTLNALKSLIEVLKEHDIEYFIESTFNERIAETNINVENEFTELDESFDLLISLGGDGTILRSASIVGTLNIPIIGINVGRLGFLSSLSPNSIHRAIKSIYNKEFKISKRAIAEVEVFNDKNQLENTFYALNEVAVSRKNTTSMITTFVNLDNQYLNSYWSDGLIIATPTGSTGYSLSCGGPILSPESKDFIITPIAPHNLNARPLVIPDHLKIDIKVNSREPDFLLSTDSQITSLSTEHTLSIHKAKHEVSLVELRDDRFVKTLREKLLWGKDKRN